METSLGSLEQQLKETWQNRMSLPQPGDRVKLRRSIPLSSQRSLPRQERHQSQAQRPLLMVADGGEDQTWLLASAAPGGARDKTQKIRTIGPTLTLAA